MSFPTVVLLALAAANPLAPATATPKAHSPSDPDRVAIQLPENCEIVSLPPELTGRGDVINICQPADLNGPAPVYGNNIYTPEAIEIADLGDHWSKPYIETLIQQGVLPEPVDGQFRPDAPLTHGELTAWLDRALETAAKAETLQPEGLDDKELSEDSETADKAIEAPEYAESVEATAADLAADLAADSKEESEELSEETDTSKAIESGEDTDVSEPEDAETIVEADDTTDTTDAIAASEVETDELEETKAIDPDPEVEPETAIVTPQIESPSEDMAPPSIVKLPIGAELEAAQRFGRAATRVLTDLDVAGHSSTQPIVTDLQLMVRRREEAAALAREIADREAREKAQAEAEAKAREAKAAKAAADAQEEKEARAIASGLDPKATNLELQRLARETFEVKTNEDGTIDVARFNKELRGKAREGREAEPRVSRLEAVVGLVDALNLTPPKEQPEADKVVLSFGDADRVPVSAETRLQTAIAHQLVVPDADNPDLHPHFAATRADVAVLLYRALVKDGRLAPIVMNANSALSKPDFERTTDIEIDVELDTEIAASIISDDLAFQLFADPDSPGVIAIGMAEGTRTVDGGKTYAYWGHTDPGNSKHNLGSFSYQHGATSPAHADMLQLQRMYPYITAMQEFARDRGMSLSPLELVAGIDLATQAPLAAQTYLANLKEAKAQGFAGMEAIFEARSYSYINPYNGQLEASGFDNDWGRLRFDQARRIAEIRYALDSYGVQ